MPTGKFLTRRNKVVLVGIWFGTLLQRCIRTVHLLGTYNISVWPAYHLLSYMERFMRIPIRRFLAWPAPVTGVQPLTRPDLAQVYGATVSWSCACPLLMLISFSLVTAIRYLLAEHQPCLPIHHRSRPPQAGKAGTQLHKSFRAH